MKIHFNDLYQLFNFSLVRKPLKYVKKLKKPQIFLKENLFARGNAMCALLSFFFFLQVHSAVYAFIVDSVKEGAAELF